MKQKKMTSLSIAICVFAATVTTLNSQSRETVIESLPASIDEFIKRRDMLATTPEGGAAMLWMALATLGQDRQLGMQFLTIALDQQNLRKGNIYKGYAPAGSIQYHLDRLASRSVDVWTYLPFAYVKGSSPDNDYQTNPPYTLEFSRNDYSGQERDGKVKVFLAVYGVTPRPITMHRNDKGIWKAYELSSMFLDVAAPESSKPKDEL